MTTTTDRAALVQALFDLADMLGAHPGLPAAYVDVFASESGANVAVHPTLATEPDSDAIMAGITAWAAHLGATPRATDCLDRWLIAVTGELGAAVITASAALPKPSVTSITDAQVAALCGEQVGA